MSFLTKFEDFDPFEELALLRNRFDRLMNRFPEETELFTTQWAPRADILETKNAILIKAELPGMTEKDIHIEMENGVLTINGERTFEKETADKDYRRVERSYGKFIRSFTLPTNVSGDKITASYNNGLLEIELPKKEEAKPKTIHIDVKKKLSAAA